MEATTLEVEQAWRWLWSDSAHRIVETLDVAADCEPVAIGYGWGLRRADDPRRAILLYPSANRRAAGDLALVVPGGATQIIPRGGADYAEYVDVVASAVDALALAYLED
jgi:hypothetical protein